MEQGNIEHYNSRVVTSDFRERIQKNNIYICEKHFELGDFYVCKYAYFSPPPPPPPPTPPEEKHKMKQIVC